MVVVRNRTYFRSAYGRKYIVSFFPPHQQWKLYLVEDGVSVFSSPEFDKVKDFVEEEIQYQSTARRNLRKPKTSRWTSRDRTSVISSGLG